MSRNLCSSVCVECGGHTFKLEDMRGKPIEFHAFPNQPPNIGCKCACPKCGTVYFLWWNAAKWQQHPFGAGYYGNFSIDLSFYESFNDEHSYDYDAMAKELGVDANGYDVLRLWYKTFPDRAAILDTMDDVWSLVKDNREEWQTVLGSHYLQEGG